MKIRGFSLIEILVAIAIFAILTGRGVASFSSFQRQKRVISAARKIESELQKNFAAVRAEPVFLRILCENHGCENFFCDENFANCTEKSKIFFDEIFFNEKFSVNFLPPFAEISIFDKNGNSAEKLEIEIKNNFGNQKNLRIWQKSGLIEIF